MAGALCSRRAVNWPGAGQERRGSASLSTSTCHGLFLLSLSFGQLHLGRGAAVGVKEVRPAGLARPWERTTERANGGQAPTGGEDVVGSEPSWASWTGGLPAGARPEQGQPLAPEPRWGKQEGRTGAKSGGACSQDPLQRGGDGLFLEDSRSPEDLGAAFPTMTSVCPSFSYKFLSHIV